MKLDFISSENNQRGNKIFAENVASISNRIFIDDFSRYRNKHPNHDAFYVHDKNKVNKLTISKLPHKFRRATLSTIRNQRYQSFHQMIKPFLVMGNCFAILPVQGVTAKSASSLRFSYFSLKFLYTVIILIVFCFSLGLTINWMIRKSQFKLGSMTPLLWIVVHTFVMFTFIGIAKGWPEIMKDWEKVESELIMLSIKRQRSLKRWIFLITYGIPFLALCEHVLAIANGFQTGTHCKKVKSMLEGYLRQSFGQYYTFFEYSLISGCCLQVLNAYTTFLWNYTDMFIIILCLGLAGQFQHFNEHFTAFIGKDLPNEFWGDKREYYNALTNLVELVDKRISIIIVVSFSNNLYLICTQLFYSVSPITTVIRGIYFWFSMLFLIGRTLLVSMAASRIYDEAKKPSKILRKIPSKVYLEEATRFLDHVTTSSIALSGKKFFFITRKFILTVAGTIVTYELVLVQLERETGDPDADPCAYLEV